MMANSYHAYANLTEYQSWIELFGLTDEEPIAQKRILSIVSGAVLPLVALGFIKSLTDYIKPEVTPTMLHPVNVEQEPDQAEALHNILHPHPVANPITGEFDLSGETLPIKQEIFFESPVDEEETPNGVQDDDNIYETQIESETADAVSVNDEQLQDLSPIDDNFEESDSLDSPHKRTGEFVGKPKNWGMRFPPIKL